MVKKTTTEDITHTTAHDARPPQAAAAAEPSAAAHGLRTFHIDAFRSGSAHTLPPGPQVTVADIRRAKNGARTRAGHSTINSGDRYDPTLVEVIAATAPDLADRMHAAEHLAVEHAAVVAETDRARSSLAEYPKVRQEEVTEARIAGKKPPEDRTEELRRAVADLTALRAGIAERHRKLAAEIDGLAVEQGRAVYAGAKQLADSRASEAISHLQQAVDGLARTRVPVRVMDWAKSPLTMDRAGAPTAAEQQIRTTLADLQAFLDGETDSL